jgi:hypothetical protein
LFLWLRQGLREVCCFYQTGLSLTGGYHHSIAVILGPNIAREMLLVSCDIEIGIHRFRLPPMSYSHLWYCTFQHLLRITLFPIDFIQI